MRVMVTGSRGFEKKLVVRAELLLFVLDGEETHFILGDCKTGVDKIALEFCENKKIKHTVYQADWNGLGSGAGPSRNARMIQHGKPDIVLAFWDGKVLRSGTLDSITQAIKAGVRVEITPVPEHTVKMDS